MGDAGAVPLGVGDGGAVPLDPVGAHTGSPGMVARAGLAAVAGLVDVAGLLDVPGLVADPGLVTAAGLVDALEVGVDLADGDATSYRYRLYCFIRLMSFVP